ncbi:nucleotidyltransferase family protein [Qipengyuania flava]|uniref:nucleotidyltransferase family protein n=1 Tax=Qipengyuania flava TaxID=192812 RepID=UPI001C625D6C|nr:nucleotidyltransferase family protein [Qipengyuania flava]QYJ07598.1 nucleotidyltransferase family protein [Qipengyuania flava]
MAERPRVAIALLAAGRSQRFGAQDKLAAELGGKPLGLYAAHTLARCEAESRWVIASSADHPCAEGWRAAGFDIAVNPRASEGMGTSVALAAELAKREGADSLLVALADMPLVPLAHFRAVLDAADGVAGHGVVASSSGAVPMPPACFNRARFDELMQLEGDKGARSLLQDARLITCPAEYLADVDDPTTLADLRKKLGAS